MKLPSLPGKSRKLALLAVSLSLGGLSAFAVRSYIADEVAVERERVRPRENLVAVVVAKRDLARGAVLDQDAIAARDLPRDHLPASVIPASAYAGVLGGRLGVALRAGEPLLKGSLESPDSAGFASRLESGKRALTIPVDETNSVSGLLRVGDYLDLMITARPPQGPGVGGNVPEVTRPLVQRVRVLATGKPHKAGGEDSTTRSFTSITLELTPAQAQQVIVALKAGKLTALLRAPGDEQVQALAPSDLAALVGERPRRGVLERPPPEVLIGGQGGLRLQNATGYLAVPIHSAAASAVPSETTSSGGVHAPSPPGVGSVSGVSLVLPKPTADSITFR